MRNTLGKTRMIAILLMVLCCSIKSFAGIHHTHGTIKTTYGGTPVVINQPEAKMTVNPVLTIFPHTDVAVNNLLTLGVNHDYKGYFAPMEVKVTLELEQFNAGMVLTSTSNIELIIKYDPFSGNTFIDKNTYKFSGAYKFIAKIIAIEVDGIPGATELPGNLFIDGDIFIERYFSFVTSSNPIVMHPIDLQDEAKMIDTDCDGLVDEFEISWPTIPGVEEYQLEWTFVNDYDVTAGDYMLITNTLLKFDFRNNATRISTTDNFYRITNAFEHGYVLFRVRGIGRDLNNLSKIITGVWSSVDMGQVNSNPVRIPIVEFDPLNTTTQQIAVHEGNKNWQFSTTFAEEGKKKDVVSYFDGSLRNRQTVTKINSDNNTIVGETIYDHQGRPAVTVLPVPVTDPTCVDANQESSIKFYPDFNKSEATNDGYSKEDFDLDYNGQCELNAEGMKTNSGASNYYSPANQDVNGIQAYVPDAQSHPFTQVEYTPDNTGRIRRQSGVGIDFKLGSNHETKYFYQQPFQIQLNRLFGSEVGDASHYKKNMVIDPNGQVSVSYLDQEGRVVATSLAGDAPTNLEAIASASDAAKELTEDLFKKDLNGNSTNNHIANNAVVFSTQLGVAWAGNYEFEYNLNVDPLTDLCTPTICLNCIYDFKIRISDECNLTFYESESMIGHFTEGTEGFVFSTECSPTEHTLDANSVDENNDPVPFTVYLPAGTYTVSKTLTINDEARDFYIQKYIESNTCIETLEDFQEEFVSQIDLSDCAIGCEECAESLGERDDFVSQGKGSAMEYDLLMEQCLEPCKDASLCEASYQMMLADVSPGGQYAEFLTEDNITNPSLFVLSVLNVPNGLPQGGFSNWKHPRAYINGNTYNEYFNEDGIRFRIIMTVDVNGNLSPQTVNHSINTPSNTTGDIFLDAVTQEFFTYPENLANVSDFISFFQPSWAQSLVTYHPEYCYYETCIGYSIKKENDEFSSESFDNILIRTSTYTEAVAEGLINPSNPTSIEWFNSSNTMGPWDPFVVNALDFDNYGLELQIKFNNYYNDGVNNYNMAQFAAMTVRCGSNVGITPTTSNPNCYAFGTGSDVAILDQEWAMLKSLYRSYKIQLQNEYADENAINTCNGFNGCIGIDNYSPYNSGMLNTSGGIGGWSNSPYFDYTQPCGMNSWFLYRNKVKRFPKGDEIPVQNASDVAYQHYLLTGQCPNAFSLQNLISALAENGALDASNEDLNAYPETMAVLLASNNYTITNPVPVIEWRADNIPDNILNVELWNNTDNTMICELQLDITGTTITSWDDIEGITNLQSTNTSMPSTFTATALVNVSGVIVEETISGKTECLNLFNCRFNTECNSNQFADEIEMMMTLLAMNGDLTANTVDLEAAPYFQPASPNNTGFAVSTPLIKEVVSGLNTNSLKWHYNSTTHLFSITNVHNANVLEIAIESLEPSTFNLTNLSQIQSFSNVVSEWSNAFAIDAFDATGNLLVTIHGSVVVNDGNDITPISMGECALPDAIACEGEGFEVLHDLNALLKDVLLTQEFTTDINLFGSTSWTVLLQTYLASELTSTSSTYIQTNNGNDHVDVLDFEMEGCHLTLTHKDDAGFPKDFTQMVGMSNLVAIGDGDEEGNMFEFYFLATYDISGDLYTDTVFGSTCFPMRNCTECPETPKVDPELEQLQEEDQQMLADGITKENFSLEIYDKYVAAVDDLNQRMGWNPGDSLFIPKMNYVNYFHEGMYYPGKSYVRHMKYYDADIDDHDLICHPDSFAVNYGYGTNIKIEHSRYKKAVQRYNQRAVNASLPTMSIMEDTTFAKTYIGDSIGLYIEYIEQMPQGAQVAEEPVNYLMSINAMTAAAGGTCEDLYESYVDAWKFFSETQQLNNSCLHYEVFSPMFSLQNFEDNNLCCSQAGLDLIQDYIDVLLNGPDCPGSLPYIETCSGDPSDDPAACQKSYIEYRNSVTAFNFSPWAIANNQMIPLQYETFDAFLLAGKCNCINSWLVYILTYIKAEPTAILPPAQSLNDYTDCPGEFVVTGENPCEEEYEQYLNCVAVYNMWAKENNGISIKEIVKFEGFVNNNLCFCADAYCTALNNVMAGIITDPKEIAFVLNIIRVCDLTTEIPCTPEIPINTSFVSPPAPESNPCEEYMMDMAMLNGQNAYDLYIDSIINEIASRYDQHCLNALESFEVTYTDKEYHFTLYYYDQAGNLIKTVPPEGVQLLPLDNSNPNASLLNDQINDDRTHNRQTIFTQHRLATQYEYNSLNQLVKQSMPDHDKMDIFEITLPNGLNAALETQSIQMINTSLGYLSGNVGTRGYLYQTNDGGVTWTRVHDLVGATLKKVQMIPSTSFGYAVGSDGIVLKTSDGGDNWDVLTKVYDLNVVDDLNDLYFVNDQLGVIVGENGRILKTTDGGATFTTYLLNSTLPSAPFFQNITSITHNGTNYFISVEFQFLANSERIGQIYTSATANTSPLWNEENSISGVNVNSIYFYDAALPNNAYGAGVDGSLLHTTNGGNSWNSRATNINFAFKQVLFKDVNEGIALVETSIGVNELFKTQDAGATWELISEAGENYAQMDFYYQDALYGAKALAVGKDGLVKKIIMENNTPFGLIDVDFTLNSDLTTVWSEEIHGNLYAIVINENGTIFETKDAAALPPDWNVVTTVSQLATNDATQITAKVMDNTTNPAISGTILSSDGKLYSLFKPLNNTNYTVTPFGGINNEIMKGLTLDNNNNRIYTFDNDSKKAIRIDLNASGATSAISLTLNQISGISSATNTYFSNSKLVVIGTNADIYTGTLNPAGAAITGGGWQKRTFKIYPLQLREIYNEGTTIYAAGENGTVLQRQSNADWHTLHTTMTENINGLLFEAGQTAMVGDNGLLRSFTVTGNNLVATAVPINNGTVTENLHDIKLVGAAIYAAGENGTILYTSNSLMNGLAITQQNTSSDFYGLAIKPSTSQMYAVGENSKIHWLIGANKTVIKNVFGPGLKDAHFSNANCGTIIGNNYTIRKTTNGGLTWKVIQPSNGTTQNVILNEVQTIDRNYSLVVGNNNYLGVIENGISTNNSGLVTGPVVDLLSIAFDPDDLNGYIGNSKSTLLGLNLTPNGNSYTMAVNNGLFVSPAQANTKINALYVFDNGSVMAAGDNNFIGYFDGTNWLANNLSLTNLTGAVFKDIFFHDHLNGYVVGDLGIMLKSKDASLNSNGFLTGINWDQKSIIDDLNITSNPQADINAIAFASRYNGVWGGTYNIANNTQYPYVRLIRDESELFSTYFFYDKLGRIVVSQNTKQFNKTPIAFSYSLYDELGRVTQAGEKQENSGSGILNPEFQSIFGTTIANYFNPKIIDDAHLNTWVNGDGDRIEVTQNYYDKTVIAGLPVDFIPDVQTQRKRITHVTYEDVFDGDDATYEHATHYDYDIHGNVKTLLQDNRKLATEVPSLASQQFKRMDYSYDLISGNVHHVAYQSDSADAWHHAYAYDADNRVTEVYTSKVTTGLNFENESGSIINEVMDSHLWDRDAKYFYYADGKLSRVETGDLQVQGTDYAYTLQGWVKGINSNTLDTLRDIGKDGWRDPSNLNMNFPKDVFSYSLNYFTGDYTPIDNTITGTDHFLTDLTGSDILANRYDLFNGNIGSMVTTITNPTTREVLPLGNAYKYDQLNRLLEARSFTNIDIPNNEWNFAGTYGDEYFNKFSYDANGNILTQWRFDDDGDEIDSLHYKYARNSDGNLIQNRLYHLRDQTNYNTLDLDDMGAFDGDLGDINDNNNYSYSAIGELVRNDQEEIEEIVWTVGGRLKAIKRTALSTKTNLYFDYDPMGRRIAKHTYESDDVTLVQSEYYIKEAGGNTLAVYLHKYDDDLEAMSYKLTERHIANTSVGIDQNEVEMIAAFVDTTHYSRTLGNKVYFGKNHLNNVIVQYSDKKMPKDWDNDDTVDGYWAHIISSVDVSAFGVELENRKFENDKAKYGFNGMRKDNEMQGEGNTYDFGERIYGAREGRFYSIDPLSFRFVYYSPYQMASNSPISARDLHGLQSDVQLNEIEIEVEKARRIALKSQDEMTLKDMKKISTRQKPLFVMQAGSVKCTDCAQYNSGSPEPYYFLLDLKSDKQIKDDADKELAAPSGNQLLVQGNGTPIVNNDNEVEPIVNKPSTNAAGNTSTPTAPVNPPVNPPDVIPQGGTFVTPIKFKKDDDVITSGSSELTNQLAEAKKKFDADPDNFTLTITTGYQGDFSVFDRTPASAGTKFSGKLKISLISARMDKIVEAAKAAGIPEKNIKKDDTAKTTKVTLKY